MSLTSFNEIRTEQADVLAIFRNARKHYAMQSICYIYYIIIGSKFFGRRI